LESHKNVLTDVTGGNVHFLERRQQILIREASVVTKKKYYKGYEVMYKLYALLKNI